MNPAFDPGDLAAMNENKGNLKFLFCSADKFPPFRVDVAVLFGEELASRGHGIDWILQSEETCARSYCTQWKGGRVWVGRTDNGGTRLCRLRKHIYNLFHSFKMLKLAHGNQYDFIQVKDQFLVALVGILAAKLNDTRFFYWLSYPFPEASLYAAEEGSARYPVFYRFRGMMFKFLLYKVIMPFADEVFVQSEQMKRDVAREGIAESKLTAVPMGVSMKKISGLVREEDACVTQDSEERVVYLGTLIRERRIDFLVRVMALVTKSRPGARLYLVGDGEDPEDTAVIRNEARRLNMEDAVVITGFLPQKDALKYVRGAKVCVSPFYPTPILNSTSPTKVVEYMALGRPVVANDHPEQEMVLRESRGGVCVAYDEAAFARAVVELLENPGEAEEMGERGRAYVLGQRSYEKIADLVENRYREACRGK